jgi:hypothetical protein
MIKLINILAEVKERSIPDLNSKEAKRLGLKQNQFKDYIFKKDFQPIKNLL